MMSTEKIIYIGKIIVQWNNNGFYVANQLIDFRANFRVMRLPDLGELT